MQNQPNAQAMTSRAGLALYPLDGTPGKEKHW
jgi:hypothetical protein